MYDIDRIGAVVVLAAMPVVSEVWTVVQFSNNPRVAIDSRLSSKGWNAGQSRLAPPEVISTESFLLWMLDDVLKVRSTIRTSASAFLSSPTADFSI